MELEKDAHPIFNSILVVTDRRILDKQIRDNIKQFAQVGNVVAWAEHSGDLCKAITDGKRIIITTIEKFHMLYRILVLNTKIINLQFLSMRLIPVKTGVTLHK